jgi:acylpyruvate hydrolase
LQIGAVHHEVELAVVVDRLARKVPEAKALEHAGGYALAIDLTARDLQEEAKKVRVGRKGWMKG